MPFEIELLKIRSLKPIVSNALIKALAPVAASSGSEYLLDQLEFSSGPSVPPEPLTSSLLIFGLNSNKLVLQGY